MDRTASLALKIDRLMRLIHAELHPRAPEFDLHNVGPIGGMLLIAIGESEPVDVGTIVHALGRDKSQVSRLVQSMERKGLIQRTQNAEDARVSILQLTSDGRAQVTGITEALTDIVDGLFAPLNPEERTQFQALLDIVLKAEN